MKHTPNVAPESCNTVLPIINESVIPLKDKPKEMHADNLQMRVWVFSEGVTDVSAFMQACDMPTHQCSKFISAETMRTQMTSLIQQLRDDQPDLLWIALSQLSGRQPRYAAAVRVLMYEQLRAG